MNTVSDEDSVSDLLTHLFSLPVECSLKLYFSSLRLKQRFAFMKPATDDIGAILDAAKVADCLLFGLSIQESLGHYADHVLSCLFAQGLPSVIFCVQVSQTAVGFFKTNSASLFCQRVYLTEILDYSRV